MPRRSTILLALAVHAATTWADSGAARLERIAAAHATGLEAEVARAFGVVRDGSTEQGRWIPVRYGMPGKTEFACLAEDGAVMLAEGLTIAERCTGLDLDASLQEAAARGEGAGGIPAGSTAEAERELRDHLSRSGILAGIVDAWHEHVSSASSCGREQAEAAARARFELVERGACGERPWPELAGVCTAAGDAVEDHVVVHFNRYMTERQRTRLEAGLRAGLTTCMARILVRDADPRLLARIRAAGTEATGELAELNEAAWRIWKRAGVDGWLDGNEALSAKLAACLDGAPPPSTRRLVE